MPYFKFNYFTYTINTFVYIVVGMLVAVIQPYESKVYNTVDIILILGVGLFYAGAICSLVAFIEAPLQRKP